MKRIYPSGSQKRKQKKEEEHKKTQDSGALLKFLSPLPKDASDEAVPSTASLIDEKDNEEEEDMEETTSTGAMASTSTYIESALHLSTGVTSTAQATLIDEEDNMGEEDMGGTTSSGTMASTSTQIASPPHLSTGDTSTAQDVEDTSGKGLTEVLLDHLQKHNLSISDCRGQSYDNGSNMMGQKTGCSGKNFAIE
ncbi:uncharacterized protein LOC143499580 isoform X3 [Brachyhypopomus gauderio]|uniref:uncharacterized protein LOC143499580 isoform X3 n=1 Tax=Brachyhypopomus gauderio TaxID=698409 RepID=UPI004041B76C